MSSSSPRLASYKQQRQQKRYQQHSCILAHRYFKTFVRLREKNYKKKKEKKMSASSSRPESNAELSIILPDQHEQQQQQPNPKEEQLLAVNARSPFAMVVAVPHSDSDALQSSLVLPDPATASPPAVTEASLLDKKQHSSTYSCHGSVRLHERVLDDLRYRWTQARQPLHKWKLRHWIALYCLQRFVLKPIMYAPGILAFYHLRIGRRMQPFIVANFSKQFLPRVCAPGFWRSGFSIDLYLLIHFETETFFGNLI